jgi:alpha-glucosidase
VPIPWESGGPPYGFSPPGATAPWLPQPPSWDGLAVAVQSGDPGSMLELYRAALRLRHSHPALGDGTVHWLEAPDGVLAFAREPGFTCVVNLSGPPVPLPAGTEPLLTSAPLTADREVPSETAVWLSS